MNKNGFTLIELLAVIVILALLTLLTSTAITKIVKDSKQELSDTQITMIESAAKLWATDNLDKLPDDGECGYLTLEDLKEFGLIDPNVIDPKSNQNIQDSLLIKISTTNSSYGVPVTTYEVNPTSISGCKHSAIICELVSGNSKATGSKYTCQLDEERTFYVLKNNSSSNKIILILDQNYIDDYVPSKMTWCISGRINDCEHDKLDIYINYLQEKFGSIVEVSAPTRPQLVDVGCTATSNNSCPSWLRGNLNNSTLKGYWTLTPNTSSNNTIDAYNVYYAGKIGGYNVDYGVFGLRPTITLSKNLLN